MQTFNRSYRGLSLLMDLNWDRFYFAGALGLGLILGAWIATL
jgi:hypothetical protein